MQFSVLVINTSRDKTNRFLDIEMSDMFDDDENLFDWSDNLHNQSGLGDIHSVL